MTSPIKDKSTLEAEIQALFPDNSTGAITAAKLRTYLQESLDSANLQRVETIYLIGATETLVVSDIDENKRFFAVSPAAQTITLPEVTPALQTLNLNIVSASTNGVTFASASPVTGDTTTTVEGVYNLLASIAEGWLISFTPFHRPELRSLAFTLGHQGLLASGEYFSAAGVAMDTADKGLVAPFNLVVRQYALARSDLGTSQLQFFIDGVLVDAQVTSSLRGTGEIYALWPQGSLLRVKNEGVDILSPVLSLVSEYDA